MLDHINRGCPTNSRCNAETGEKYWKLNLLAKEIQKRKSSDKENASAIEEFRKTHGLPIGFWSIDPLYKNPGVVSWNSHCPHHRKKESEIFLGEMMVKEFNDIHADQFFARTWRLTSDNKILSYRFPRGDFPLALSGKDLFIPRDVDGIYYALLLDHQGKFRVTTNKVPKKLPTEVKCPKELVTAFGKEKQGAYLYQEAYCKALWDEKAERFDTLIFGWSCN